METRVFLEDCGLPGSHLASREVTTPLLTSPPPSLPLAFQWLNQSHNACVNYANRNATKVSMADHRLAAGCRQVGPSSLPCGMFLPFDAHFDVLISFSAAYILHVFGWRCVLIKRCREIRGLRKKENT